MGTVNEIVEAYQQLDAVERIKLLKTLNDMADDEWDKQIAADAESGKLDALFEEANQAYKQGEVVFR